jgi:hypothetical protein
MQIDPTKSRQTHTETAKRNPVAASTVQPSASSPAPGTRDSQPASCRGGDAGQQPFHRLLDANGDPSAFAVGEPRIIAVDRRSVRPIPALVLHSILDHRPNLHDRLAANDRAYREAERKASGGKLGLAIMFAVAFVIALMFATGGAL